MNRKARRLKAGSARTARRAQQRKEFKIGKKADLRGSRTPGTVSGLEAAVAERGYDALAEKLISRHNQRMQRFVASTQKLQEKTLPALSSYLPLYYTARELGASEGRPPFYAGPSWPDQLVWGLDSVAAAVRLLLSLQPIGAAVIARTQLERWSVNLESNSKLDKDTDEDTAEWLDRLWSQPGSGLPSRIVTGEIYRDLSEVLHGRGPLMSLVWLDIADITNEPSSEHHAAIAEVCDALLISVTRIRAGLSTEARRQCFPILADTADRIILEKPSESFIQNVEALLFPVIPELFSQTQGPVGAHATGFMTALRELGSDEEWTYPVELWPPLSFGFQRFRALSFASLAFERERKFLGDRFDPAGISRLMTEAVLAGEMAGVLATWLRDDENHQHAAAALAVAASALRSSQWLWMEDDPRAMGSLRCVVEQIARARMWRTKPARATRLEASSRTSPRDWVEGAGWRRLTLMSKALGEFAHGRETVSWSKAREALVAIQEDADTDTIAQHTGRTHALTALIFMLSNESTCWLDLLSPDLGKAFRQVSRIDDAAAGRAMEGLLKRAWDVRTTPVR